MAEEDKYLPALHHWQRTKFRSIEVSLVDAAKAAQERRNEIVHPIQQGFKWIVSFSDSFAEGTLSDAKMSVVCLQRHWFTRFVHICRSVVASY